MTAESETSSDPDLGTPIRASFSMNRGSREAIRWVAERYGMDQSDIVNLAPVLFVIGRVAGMYAGIAALDAALCEGAGMAAYA